MKYSHCKTSNRDVGLNGCRNPIGHDGRFSGTPEKKRNAQSVDQHDSARGGVEWSSQQSHLCGGPLQAVQPPRGHTFISFVISITCLPSLNKGVTLPYLTPTLSYSFEGKGTLSYTFLGKIVFLPQTHFPSLSKALE